MLSPKSHIIGGSEKAADFFASFATRQDNKIVTKHHEI